mmetsp:Transcript_23817/g.24803  ORF Transcript_23817/g.24803 Transcript_23817/m.24803 type:complete len:459 (-) Transcript_23817:70-1446(-)
MIDVQKTKQQAIEFAKAAIDAESKLKYEEAFSNYVQAIQKLKLLKENDENKYNHETYKKKATEYFEKANEIKAKYLSGGSVPSSAPTTNSNDISVSKIGGTKPPNNNTGSGANGDGKKEDPKKENPKKADKEEDEESKKMQEALSSCMVTEKPNVRWEDVAGLEKAKEALKEAVILPLKFKHLFNEKRRPWKGILLYGPPGTGKSFLAKACATEVKGTFYSVSASNIMSKWVGEAERTVRALFDLARQNKPAVIFLDEIDSLLSARGDGEQESTRRVKTEFLVQMQGVGKDDTGILVLGATNIPWDLDQAVRRRFQKKIYIPLPEKAARLNMFKLNLGDTMPHLLGEEDYKELSELTDGYSGSDIATLTQDAIYEPLRKCQQSRFFKNIEGGNFLPCSPSDEGAMKMTLNDIEVPETLMAPDICRDDFIKALSKIRPTVGANDLVRQEQFTEEFGQDG